MPPNPNRDPQSAVEVRRDWLLRAGMGLGTVALADVLHRDRAFADQGIPSSGILNPTHHRPTAKRVIYLFMAGGPSQLETFDYKPLLNEQQGQPLPDSVRAGQRLTGMSGNQATLPLAGSIFAFKQHGKSGAWVSELLPQTAKHVDDMAILQVR